MMVQTLIPCSPASKKDEILSRYRPIAPKPELPANTTDGLVDETKTTSPKIKHSPYLRNIWAHLQARPTRTRKRGRSSITPSSSLKRQQLAQTQTPFLGLCCPSPLGSPTKCLSLQGFISPNYNGLEDNNNNKPVTLPLLPNSPMEVTGKTNLDLNFFSEGLEEKDLILQLKPWTTPHVIIAPKPIRPIGSIIKVGPMSPNPRAESESKKPEVVEAEVESEELPSVISDSSNRVRMVNSAYKELVGQPECPWLDCLANLTGRRISGEVMLHMPESELPVSSNGFSCWAKIEWGTESVDAFCDVVKLHCDRKDYLFCWRFHTKQANVSTNQ